MDAGSDPDLFWALRGGGGGYAIVTALHLELLPVAEAYAGGLLFPSEIGADGLRLYRDWAANAPEEAATMIRFLNLPPIPDVPEPLRGQSLLAIAGRIPGQPGGGREGVRAAAGDRRAGDGHLHADARARPHPDRDGPGAAGARPRPPPGHQRAPGRGDRRLRRGRRARFGFAAAARRAPPAGRRACPPRRERRCPRQARRRVRHARHRDADGPGDAGADPGPARQALSRDGALGRRRRLLQLRRASLRRRGDPAGRDVQPARAGEAQLGSRRAASWRTTRSRWRRR